ncbi:Ig-like domain repeat protein [Terriglobus sp. RCC_193]|uniref:Ig-like domain repeat protein n=1 Tax=Terriglobus sp. RCC_193 TaxID=3239218 RepID=UPI003524EE4F
MRIPAKMSPPRQMTAPAYIAKVYIADTNNSAIHKYAPSGSGYIQLSDVANGLNNPRGVAVDGNGNVYIADTNNNRVLKETLSSGAYTQSTIANGLNNPQSVAVDGNGNVYIPDPNNNRVLKETLSSGTYTQSTIASGLNSPGGVAVDGNGNVYFSNYDTQRIVKIDIADPPSLSFATAPVGTTSSDSPKTVTLINNGNADLSFPSPSPSGNNPSISTNFILSSSSGTACPLVNSSSSAPGTLAANTSCDLPISFSPTAAGSISGSLILTDNHLNATAPYATQTIALSGTAIQPVTATLAVVSSTLTANHVATPFTPVTGSGGTAPLSYTASPGLPAGLSFNTATGTVSGTPTVTSAATTYTVTVTDTNGATATANFSLTVVGDTPTVSFTVPQHTYGDAPFTVTATSNSTGAFTYSVVSGPATISGNTVTITGAGTVTLQVDMAATALYLSGTATTSFNVAPAIPTLNFAAVGAKTYGDAPFAVSATSASNGTVTYTVVSGPATIAGSTVTITGAGAVTLQASQATAGNYATATATTSFNVAPAIPTLSFAVVGTKTYGDAPFPVSATSASNGAVTYSVVNGPATIAGSTVTITGAGTVALKADQAAAGNYATATATTSFNVAPAIPRLSFAVVGTKTYGDAPFSVTATSNSTGAFTYSVMSGPATISGSTVTIIGAGTVTLQASQAAAGNYAAATATTSFNVAPAVATVNFAVPAHTYGDAPFGVGATSNSTGAFTYSVVSGPATIAGSTVTIIGAGAVILQANQAEDSNYQAGAQHATFLVTQAPLTVSANNTSRIYGTANSTFTGSIAGAKYNDSFMESFSTSATQTTPVGSYAIVPAASGPNLNNYTVSATNGTLIITQAGTATSLTTSNVSAAANQSVTLTATVTSLTSGTPTGTVTILDNGTALQTVPLANGAASFTTTLAPGVTHTLTARYVGDINFLASVSAGAGTVVTVAPQDFTFSGSGSPASQTVIPGSAVSFTFNLAPSSGNNSYPAAVSLAVSGCPQGATCTLSPIGFAANAGPQTVTLTVQTAAVTARRSENHTPWSLALLLLPLAGARRVRRSSQRLQRLLFLFVVVIVGGATLVGLSGCGSGNGFLAQQPQDYTITVTATSGGAQHVSTVILNLQ